MFKITQSVQSGFRRVGLVALCVLSVSALPACSDSDDDEDDGNGGGAGDTSLSFFVTSTTHTGNLGGLAGADQICETLASAVGAGDRTWRAYLSAEDGGNGTPVNARERIGTGPWYNRDGVMMAENLTALHMLSGDATKFITELGTTVNGQWNSSNGMNGAPANEHDIMTGSDTSGNLLIGAMNSTCDDWTSDTLTPGPQVGHTDGMGPGMDTSTINYTSWNGGHPAAGCSAADLAERGSAGRLYCFAAD
jgi:hypothetical protein